jgi:hypothetical protein
MLKGLDIKKPFEIEEAHECGHDHNHHHDHGKIETIDSDDDDQFFTE